MSPPHTPLVYISYDPNEVELRSSVQGLADRLRMDGVEATVDLYEPAPAVGHPTWRMQQLRMADFVIVVCTASYRQHFEATQAIDGGHPVMWEAEILRTRKYLDPAFKTRLLPVLLTSTSTDAVPELLRTFILYPLPKGYQELYRRITGQPAIIKPPLGKSGRPIDNLGSPYRVFEGREAELTTIRDTLTTTGRVVISGLGGIGKTRLARAHAFTCAADYDLRWWLRAGDLASLQEDLVRLGTELGILSNPQQVERSAAEVVAWLSMHERWLLVLDEAKGPVHIRDMLPTHSGGHMIITSTARAWRGVAEVVEVGKLSPAAARGVLLQRSGASDDGCAAVVADALSRLPLALVQAGAYMDATKCSFQRYLEHFEQDGLELLSDPKSAPGEDHELTVARTWEVSLAAIRARSPAAAALLDWLAFLDPLGVPTHLFGECTELLPTELADCARSSRTLDDAIAVLLDFSMIERDQDVLRVHALVQAVTRDKLGTEGRQRVAGAVVRWVRAIFAYEPGHTRISDVPVGIAEQVMAVSTIGACVHANEAWIAQALSAVGDFHLVRGTSQQARRPYERALEIQDALSRMRPLDAETRGDLATSLDQLGTFEQRRGDMDVARRHFERAIELRRSLMLADPYSSQAHRDVAASLIRLGDLELLCGTTAVARAHFARAVEIQVSSTNHAAGDPVPMRRLAIALERLGRAHTQAGHFDAARAVLRRGLELAEAALLANPGGTGAKRDVSNLLNALGDAMARAGDDDAADAVFSDNLAIVEQLAHKDPHSARARRDLSIALNRCGRTAQRLGRLDAARNHFSRASHLRAEIAAADPLDPQAQNDLSSSFQSQGELEVQAGNHGVACEHFRRAIEQQEALLRNDPRNGGTRQRLAMLIERLDELRSADSARINKLIDQSEVHPWTLPETLFIRRIVPRDEPGIGGKGHGPRVLSSMRDGSPAGKTRTPAEASERVDSIAAKDLYYRGKKQRDLGNLVAAQALFRDSAQLFASIVERRPNSRSTKRDLAVSLGKLGKLEGSRDQQAARRSFLRSVELLDELATATPWDVLAHEDLSRALARLGSLDAAAGDLAAARVSFQRHVDIESRLAEHSSARGRPRQHLLDALTLLGDVEVKIGTGERTREILRRVIVELQGLETDDTYDIRAALDLVLLHAEPPPIEA